MIYFIMDINDGCGREAWCPLYDIVSFFFLNPSDRIDCGRYPKHYSDESHHSDPAQVRKF